MKIKEIKRLGHIKIYELALRNRVSFPYGADWGSISDFHWNDTKEPEPFWSNVYAGRWEDAYALQPQLRMGGIDNGRIKQDEVIHCETQALFDAVLHGLEIDEYVWGTGYPPTSNKFYWAEYKENSIICAYPNDKKIYKGDNVGSTTIKAEDWLKGRENGMFSWDMANGDSVSIQSVQSAFGVNAHAGSTMSGKDGFIPMDSAGSSSLAENSYAMAAEEIEVGDFVSGMDDDGNKHVFTVHSLSEEYICEKSDEGGVYLMYKTECVELIRKGNAIPDKEEKIEVGDTIEAVTPDQADISRGYIKGSRHTVTSISPRLGIDVLHTDTHFSIGIYEKDVKLIKKGNCSPTTSKDINKEEDDKGKGSGKKQDSKCKTKIGKVSNIQRKSVQVTGTVRQGRASGSNRREVRTSARRFKGTSSSY